MITVPVHKDVYAYEPKIVWMLTRRTLAFSAAGGALGLAAGALITFVLRLPSDVSTYAAIVITLPIWYFGFARPCKMKPEKLAPFWLRHLFSDQTVRYCSSAVVDRRCDPDMFSAEIKNERYAIDVRKEATQPHYARLRRERGIEAYDASESLGIR